MLLIIAGNHKEARAWAEQRGIPRGTWAYVIRASQITDLPEGTDAEIVCVGTWADRPDYRKLDQLLSARATPCRPTPS